MKILIIAATHGNELLGIKLYERLLKRRATLLESVDFIIGNQTPYTLRPGHLLRESEARPAY